MDKNKEFVTLPEYVKLVESYNAEDLDKVLRAYRYAEAKHAGKTRDSGAPYITHPLTVSYILAEDHADSNALCAGLLHDTVEDTNTTLDDIKRDFNEDIASLVDDATKMSNISYMNKEELNYANLRKILLCLAKSPRGIHLKLADRTHNMRTIGYKEKPEKREKKANETQTIFVPIADKFGMYNRKTELEDLSFKEINTTRYLMCLEEQQRCIEEYYDNIQKMLKNIKAILLDNNVSAEVKMRVTNVYGIYKKHLAGKNLDDMYDLLAIKIITENEMDCYKTMGLVHKLYEPYNLVNDYIASPKENLYQSLNTVVIGDGNKLTQVRIRTRAMDAINSHGLAAFWDLYRGDAKYKMQEALETSFPFYNSLKDIDIENPDNEAFLNAVSEEIFQKQKNIYYGHKKIVLPVTATTIDAAYKANPDLANKLVGVVINNHFTDDLFTPIDPEAIVEFITAENAPGPNPDWLENAKTATARLAINKQLNKKKIK